MKLVYFFVAVLSLASFVATSHVPRWLTLPPTPSLLNPVSSGLVPVNGINVWHAVFGEIISKHDVPVLFVHGGLANSDYWGLQVATLSISHQVIVMDSRGHGRSGFSDNETITYDLMTSDVVALLDALDVAQVDLVGWSDGGIIGLDLAMHYPGRLRKLFAFAANYNPSGVKNVSESAVFTEYIARTETEYATLSPTPTKYDAFLTAITTMWATLPQWTKLDFANFTTTTWAVDADHDEAVKRNQVDNIAKWIPYAGELLLPQVSHFAFIQDSAMFTSAVSRFLQNDI